LAVAWLGTMRTPLGPFVFQVTLPYLTIWAAHVNVRWMNRFGRYGDFSYGIYLFAFPTQQLLVHMFGVMPMPAFTLLAFLFTLPLAVISWYCIEKPALAWKTKTLRPLCWPLSGHVNEVERDASGAEVVKERVDGVGARAS